MKIEAYSDPQKEGPISSGREALSFPLDQVTSLRLEFTGTVMKCVAIIGAGTHLELFRAEAGTDTVSRQKALQEMARLFGYAGRQGEGKLTFEI